MESVKLTQFSHGAGCGCKISPAILDTILHSDRPRTIFPGLLVGNETKDDAAVFDPGDGNCVISTTDFFMPIVDDAETFGAIASVNAISDVYAMGGTPMMAIAILGWPIDKIPAAVASSVLDGSRAICRQAGIPLAGGHSIDCPEPVFGLAVTGRVRKESIKRNDTATEGSLLYLTKSLGIGILTTAQKRGIVQPDHYDQAVQSMLKLNDFGAKVGALPYVSALTDVTGFGFLGHLVEMCEGSGLTAKVDFAGIPKFEFLDQYLNQKCFPGGTTRNWNSYGHKVKVKDDRERLVLADPQTSGGLLLAVDPSGQAEFEQLARASGLHLKPFGTLNGSSPITVTVS
jgi:selenide, water dikinase